MNSFDKYSSSYLQFDSKAVAAMERNERLSNAGKRVLEQKMNVENKQKQYSDFVAESKSFLLTEALYHLFTKCVPASAPESLTKLGRGVIESFVNEEGATNLLIGMKGKTLLLDELNRVIEESHKKVCKGCEGKEVPFKIPKQDIKILHDDIDELEADDITKEIAKRVSAAEEEFIKSNLDDKKQMDALATATQEKINAVKAKNADVEMSIKQEHTALYHRQLERIESRKKNILEGMVLRLSKAIVTEDTVRSQYTDNTGKLDMNSIIESAEIMYTVLEMMNTIRLKNVTPAYIKEVLSSIQ